VKYFCGASAPYSQANRQSDVQADVEHCIHDQTFILYMEEMFHTQDTQTDTYKQTHTNRHTHKQTHVFLQLIRLN
jgi:hypothetical protein